MCKSVCFTDIWLKVLGGNDHDFPGTLGLLLKLKGRIKQTPACVLEFKIPNYFHHRFPSSNIPTTDSVQRDQVNLGVSDAAAKSEVSHQEGRPEPQNPKCALDSFTKGLDTQVPLVNVKCTIETFFIAAYQRSQHASAGLPGHSISDGSHPSRKPQTLDTM